MPFYAVYQGRIAGVYETWGETAKQIKGYPKAKFKKFETYNDAHHFSRTGETNLTPTLQADLQSENQPTRVFTDGSSINNGKANCKAGSAVFFGVDDPRNAICTLKEYQSNQRAELYAIKLALEILSKEPSDDTNQNGIKLYTDSAYSIKCITVWYKNWEKNNWLTAKKQPVKHKELIQEILSLINEIHCEIKFIHVRSHKPAPTDKKSEEYLIWYGNDQADKLAETAALS